MASHRDTDFNSIVSNCNFKIYWIISYAIVLFFGCSHFFVSFRFYLVDFNLIACVLLYFYFCCNMWKSSNNKAYVNHGDYNVFMVDWGVLCRPPCYVAAVHNLKPVAKCLSQVFSFLRNSGMPVQRTTCVGHSLGAHLCGLMANYLDFRIERIIGKCLRSRSFLFFWSCIVCMHICTCTTCSASYAIVHSILMLSSRSCSAVDCAWHRKSSR